MWFDFPRAQSDQAVTRFTPVWREVINKGYNVLSSKSDNEAVPTSRLKDDVRAVSTNGSLITHTNTEVEYIELYIIYRLIERKRDRCLNIDGNTRHLGYRRPWDLKSLKTSQGALPACQALRLPLRVDQANVKMVLTKLLPASFRYNILPAVETDYAHIIVETI
ncbi:hypothetical protein RRG08_064441 [Elysia crispata]|uniref:Uncharacterized protein n=1 Tax=Elysia crispata TaxID=231223 RepID=A0AAE1D7L7_9GAST|nr:hypothetical protein RRG08_064441 [Elysia crispata]